MSKYDPNEFIKALSKKAGGRSVPQCPYCGGNKFSTTQMIASIISGDNLEGINLGSSIPSGMVICQNCGHIEFFALGALGLLKGKEAPNDEK